MDINQLINDLAHEAGKYIRAQAMVAGMGSDPPVSIQGHLEIAMRKLANEVLEDCAKLADEREAWAKRTYNSNYRAAMAKHIADEIRRKVSN